MSLITELVSVPLKSTKPPMPSFSFTQDEVTTIKRIWELLQIVKMPSISSSSKVPTTKSKISTPSRLSIDSTNSPTKNSASETRDSRRNSLFISKESKHSRTASSSYALTPVATNTSIKINNSDHSSKTSVTLEESPKKTAAPVNTVLKLFEFQFKLCGNIKRYEALSKNSSESINNLNLLNVEADLDKYEFHILKNGYQTDTLVELITCIILNLNKTSEAIFDVLSRLSKINSRIWNMDNFKYKSLGECLNITILETLGRKTYSVEFEHVWIHFFNKLIDLILWSSNELSLHIPQVVIDSNTIRKTPYLNPHSPLRSTKIVVKSNPSNNDDDYSVRYLSNYTTNVDLKFHTHSISDDSTKSSNSILSLHTHDDTSSFSTLDQSPRGFVDYNGKPGALDEDLMHEIDELEEIHSVTPIDVNTEFNGMSEITRADGLEKAHEVPKNKHHNEEDDSFDLINSFNAEKEEQTKNTSKYSKRFNLKKKASFRSLNGAAVLKQLDERRNTLTNSMNRRRSLSILSSSSSKGTI